MLHLVAIFGYFSSHLHSVILAVFASVIVGFVWHGVLFVKPWAEMNALENMTDADRKAAMPAGLSASVAMAFVQAVLLGRTLQILLLEHVGHALLIAFLLWFAFIFLSLLNNYVWAKRPMKLLLIDAGYNLASLWAIAAALYYTL